MKKKKKSYTGLCYVGLIFLVILLLLPPAFRIFGKNWYYKEEEPKDLVQVLKCTKEKDRIFSSFINDVPQHFEYEAEGNYLINTAVNGYSNTQSSSTSIRETSNSIVDLIHNYAKVTYSYKDNSTLFKLEMSAMEQDRRYVGILNNLNNQKNYFSSLAFYCTVTKVDN